MTAACLTHLKMLRAWAWLYLDTAPAEKPYLAGLAADQGVVAFKALNAHEPGSVPSFYARRSIALFVEVAMYVL